MVVLAEAVQVLGPQLALVELELQTTDISVEQVVQDNAEPEAAVALALLVKMAQ